jgi:hypothetical protein
MGTSRAETSIGRGGSGRQRFERFINDKKTLPPQGRAPQEQQQINAGPDPLVKSPDRRRRGANRRRREFIAALGGAAAWPRVAHAQQQMDKIWRVGFLSAASATNVTVALFEPSGSSSMTWAMLRGKISASIKLPSLGDISHWATGDVLLRMREKRCSADANVGTMLHDCMCARRGRMTAIGRTDKLFSEVGR